MTADNRFVVALDQGTTSSRAVLYDRQGKEVRIASRELPVRFPHEAWVEQDPEEIWATQLAALREVAEGVEDRIVAIGITNQRETTVVWSRKTGKALGPAIVWQCRRSAGICARLRERGLSNIVAAKTGLVIDSYFSASKILWLQENIPGLRQQVESGEAVFGTVDSWLLYRLSGGQVFRTDPSNASRTMLYSLRDMRWDEELLRFFEVGEENLCEVAPSDSELARTTILGPEIPITAVLGDQQASLFGHGCLEKESAKCTFGTGAFLLVNTGAELQRSSSGLLSTVAWALGEQPPSYALEGSLFVAGSLIQWLRDRLGILADARSSEAKAGEVSDSGGVVIVPAFVGLGAPYWREDVRGAIFGLTRETSAAHLVRAALEAVAHQVADLFELPELSAVTEIRIDGGMSRNKLFCQLLADITRRSILPSASLETTARGAAAMAAKDLLFNGDIDALEREFVSIGRAEKTFVPIAAPESIRESRERWKRAVQGLLAG